MELTTIFIIVIVLVYATKNNKGKEIANNMGNAAVHLSAAASKASAALERQCDELLLSDAELEKLKAEAKAKLAKAETIAEDYSDIL